MLQLTNGMANASSGSYDVLQLQQGRMSNSPNQLQQALLGPQQCSSTETDLPVVLSALHNNSTVLQLLPQASSTDAMPLILQMPGPADQGMQGTTLSAGMQFVDASLTNGLQSLQPGCMSQGYLQAPQQMVLVNTTSQLAGCADAGDSNALQAQMQQLRAAVQQLNSQTAAVQQLLLTTQPGVAQGSVPVASNNMVSTLRY
jgi:outer membrane murein-binding lipoprotein Lpp